MSAAADEKTYPALLGEPAEDTPLDVRALKEITGGDSARRDANTDPWDRAVGGLARELRRLELVATLGGKKKARGTREKKAKPARRPWPGPAKQSTFVFLFQADTVYAVRNRAGELGAPGGKRDPGDRGIWDAARREFREETGADMPGGTFAYFEWGTVHHSIRVYYRHLAPDEASTLPLGEPGDPDGEEVETLWALWVGEERKGFRPHIAQAFEIFEAMSRSSRLWPDQPF